MLNENMVMRLCKLRQHTLIIGCNLNGFILASTENLPLSSMLLNWRVEMSIRSLPYTSHGCDAAPGAIGQPLVEG